MTSHRYQTALALGALALTASCATTAKESFYVLSSSAPEALAAPAPGERRVIVEAAALPDLVDRPQLVVHEDTHRVAILEQQRWGEPLRAGIARVVADSLGRQLGVKTVSSREDALRDPDCRVSLDVRRFEARPADKVTVETLWTLACTGAPRRTGWSTWREPVLAADHAAIVAAQGRALDRLSADIARAVRQPAALSQNFESNRKPTMPAAP
jgi:uncharacterized lipoprotein YmbA